MARAQYRGQVKRGLAVLSGGRVLPVGTKVLQGGEDVGVVINAAHAGSVELSLAVIKFPAAAAALTDEYEQPLKVEHCFFDAGN